MKLKVLLVSFVLASPVAQAQFSLEMARQQASTEFDSYSSAANTRGCDAELLKLQKANDEWFQNHFQSFMELRTQSFDSLNAGNAKLKVLKEMSVEMNAIKGQKTAGVTITLNSLISYFKNLNERLASILDSEFEVLMKTQENPNLNPLKISHTQAMEAMQIMTQNLSASLRDDGNHYEVSFSSGKKHFDLVFRLKADLNGVGVNFDINLLEPKISEFSLAEEQLWNRLSNAELKIDGYSVDARVRFRELREKNMSIKCIESKKVGFSKTTLGLPFTTFADANRETQASDLDAFDHSPIQACSIYTNINKNVWSCEDDFLNARFTNLGYSSATAPSSADIDLSMTQERTLDQGYDVTIYYLTFTHRKTGKVISRTPYYVSSFKAKAGMTHSWQESQYRSNPCHENSYSRIQRALSTALDTLKDSCPVSKKK